MKSFIQLMIGIIVVTGGTVAYGENGNTALERYKHVQKPNYVTEIVAFEDNIIEDMPAEGSLIYRIEGNPSMIQRQAHPENGVIEFISGNVTSDTALIHPAQYTFGTIRLKLMLESETSLAGIQIGFNGATQRDGTPISNQGVVVVFSNDRTTIINKTKPPRTDGLIGLAAPIIIREKLPIGTWFEISVAWDIEQGKMRVDFPQNSWSMELPDEMQPGGFGIIAFPNYEYLGKEAGVAFKVSKIQVIWQDDRPILLYDGQDRFFDRKGSFMGSIPPPKLPEGITRYATTGIDLMREKSLIVYGQDDLSADKPQTLKGWAIRELKTGELTMLDDNVMKGRIPFQGGGGMDGYWLMQSWSVPASLTWIDWNAYAHGDFDKFITPFRDGNFHSDAANEAKTAFTGWHDPSNALDGSMARFLKIDASWKGTTWLTVHPNLEPLAPFETFMTSEPNHPLVSHTGPDGKPTQLVVRDLDRMWYEQWAYLGHQQHVQCRGYNLFSRQDDWSDALINPEFGTEPYDAYANQAPILDHPGQLWAGYYRFFPKSSPDAPQKAPEFLHQNRLEWKAGSPGAYESIFELKMPMPSFEIPFSPANLMK